MMNPLLMMAAGLTGPGKGGFGVSGQVFNPAMFMNFNGAAGGATGGQSGEQQTQHQQVGGLPRDP